MDDASVRNSLAYRKHEADILKGRLPDKYLRLLPHIPRGRILEFGSAEGVLALLLSKRGDQVTAVERRPERHESAVRLRDAWGVDVSSPMFVCGDLLENMGHFEGKDVFIGVRSIYYLQSSLDFVFAEAAKHVPNVVLCGNGNRAQWWRDGIPNRNDRADNYYASAEGMSDLLSRHGYQVRIAEPDGDQIVIGNK